MSLRGGKLAEAPAPGLDRDGGLGRGAAITHSASTVTGHLGSSGSSSWQSEAAELIDESLARLPAGAVSGAPAAPPAPAVAAPAAPAAATPAPHGRATSPSPRGSSGAAGAAGVPDEVKVVVRVRPPLEQGRPLSYFAVEAEPTKLIGAPAEEGLTAAPARTVSVEEFGFSRVIAPTESNAQTFEALRLRELIAGVGRGFQETIFAYGQTGSGKTHTILGSGGVDLLAGPDGAEPTWTAEPGLLQLCTRELFSNVFGDSGDKALRRYVQLMCVEIKNEEVIDLLPSLGAGGGGGLGSASASSSPRGATARRVGAVHMAEETLSVKGRRTTYRKATTWSYEETMWLLREAIASREVGSSSLNSESSRSHMVIRFHVKTFAAPDASAQLGPAAGATPPALEGAGVVGSLTLVDLAGNERESPLDSVTRKGEAKAINVSLTHLNRMLLKMQSGQLDESDRRQGTLNMILYESLREDCGATMIFCIHPDRRFAASARSTLQMALRCRRIVRKKQVRRFEATGYQTELVDLRMEASALTHAHQQAMEARLRKEEELQRAAQLLQDLRSRYEEKIQDFERLRSDCESKRERAGEEDCEKQRLVHDLERKDELMQSMLHRLRDLEHQIVEKDRGQEPAESDRDQHREPLVRTPGRRARDGDAAGLKELELAQSFEDRRQELERAHSDALRALKESHEQEVRALKDALQHRGGAPEAAGASPPHSHAGEPCSEPDPSREPSIQPSWAGSPAQSSRVCFGDDEASCTHLQETLGSLGSTRGYGRSNAAGKSRAPSVEPLAGAVAPRPPRAPSLEPLAALQGVAPAPRRSVEQAATPQHHGGGARADAGRPERDQPAPRSRRSSRWRHADAPSEGPSTPRGDAGAGEVKVSNVERVLGHLQAAIAAHGNEAEQLEAVETHLGHLCRMALQARIEPPHRAQSVDVALKAARRHGGSLRVRRDVAKLLLELGSKDAAMKEDMVAKGALPLTIETLHCLLSLFPVGGARPEAPTPRAAADVCSACYRLLAALCQRSRGHQGHQASARAALEAVLHCLAVPELCCDDDSLVSGCYLIMALVDKRPENQEVVRTRDGIMLLSQMLDKEVVALENESARRSLDATRVVEQCSATLCYYIAGCLAKVAQDNEKNQQALYEVGGIDLLLRTLKTCLQSGEVVGNACVAIAHIAHRHEPSQHAARSQGAVHLILGALLAYRGDVSVQIGVCRAIATLTERNAANQREFLAAQLPDGEAETGAVALLLEALTFNPEKELLATTVCWALANLTSGNAEAMERVRTLHGLEVVVALLTRFAREERACEYICRLLNELTRGGTVAAQWNRQVLRSLGAQEAVTSVVQHHARSEGFVLLRARDALQNLSVH